VGRERSGVAGSGEEVLGDNGDWLGAEGLFEA